MSENSTNTTGFMTNSGVMEEKSDNSCDHTPVLKNSLGEKLTVKIPSEIIKPDAPPVPRADKKQEVFEKA